MQIEFSRGHHTAKALETGFGRLAAMKAPQQFFAPRRAVPNVHFVFNDCGGTVPQCIDDPAPVGVAAMPTGLHQRAVGHRSGCRVSIRSRFRSLHSYGHGPGNSLPVPHDHFRQLQANMAQRRLENGKALRLWTLDFRLET